MTVLFVITWIVIGCNASDYCPPPTLYPKYNDFEDTLEWANWKSKVGALEYSLRNLELENRLKTHLPIFETTETVISKLKDKQLLEEVRKRNLVEVKEILK